MQLQRFPVLQSLYAKTQLHMALLLASINVIATTAGVLGAYHLGFHLTHVRPQPPNHLSMHLHLRDSFPCMGYLVSVESSKRLGL